MTVETSDCNGTIWVTGPDGNVDLEMADVQISAERVDEDEIAIHAVLLGDSQSVASLYLNRAQAALIAAQINREATA